MFMSVVLFFLFGDQWQVMGDDGPHSWSPATHPKFTFRHCSGQLFSTPYGVASNENGHPEDHHFTPVPALNKKDGLVSFQSQNWPTSYICPITGLEDGRLGMVFTPGAAALDGCSFQIVAGLGNASWSSIKSTDGRYFTMLEKLTGKCVQYFAPPMGDVVLMSLPDIKSNNLTAAATWLENTPPPPPVATVISPEFDPTLSLRHCNSQLFATNYTVGGPKADHHFIVVPGLNGKSGYASFQSENFPTGYLGPVPNLELGRIGVVFNPPVNDAVSFQIVTGVGNKAMSSIQSGDGRYFTVLPTLSGTCSPYYEAPGGDVVLVSLADLQSKNFTHRATFKLGKPTEM